MLRLVLAMFVWPLLMMAQEESGVAGRVQGAGGAGLACAKVTLLHPQSQAKEETVTTEDGSFLLRLVAPGTYLLEVEAGGFEPYRASIEVGTAELTLPPEELSVIRAVISQCDFLESHWKQVEQWSGRLPRPLVHGDFKPRNVVIGPASGGPALFPFDWEASGWGVPAEDLAYVDLVSYHAAIQVSTVKLRIYQTRMAEAIEMAKRGECEDAGTG